MRADYCFTEMSDSNTCYGSGSVSTQSNYYENTLEMGLNRTRMIDESGASMASTECSACRM